MAPVATCTASPDGVDLALAALIEPLSCAIRGYDLLPRRMGEHYLIYGAGTMGLMMAQLAPRAGAASVTVVDRNPARLDVAREVGDRANWRCRPTRSADRGGWDVVIDCTGVVAAIEDGLTRVRRGGTFQQFGVAATDATRRFSPFRRLQRRAHHHRLDGGAATRYGRAVEMFAAGALTRRADGEPCVRLDDYGEALEMFRAGSGRKAADPAPSSTSRWNSCSTQRRVHEVTMLTRS